VHVSEFQSFIRWESIILLFCIEWTPLWSGCATRTNNQFSKNPFLQFSFYMMYFFSVTFLASHEQIAGKSPKAPTAKTILNFFYYTPVHLKAGRVYSRVWKHLAAMHCFLYPHHTALRSTYPENIFKHTDFHIWGKETQLLIQFKFIKREKLFLLLSFAWKNKIFSQ